MKSSSTVALLLMLGLASIARAEPSISVQTEVDFLLGYVEGSGCMFNRNGTWYDATTAQGHLRDKYKYLVAEDLINTTGDFIDMAATQSSISGQSYEVRCSGGAAVTTSQWLRDELARYRAFQ